MFTIKFWKDAAERAIRTAAQALLALWATDISGVLEADRVQAEETRAALRASAEAKLKKLGLTLDEIATVLS